MADTWSDQHDRMSETFRQPVDKGADLNALASAYLEASIKQEQMGVDLDQAAMPDLSAASTASTRASHPATTAPPKAKSRWRSPGKHNMQRLHDDPFSEEQPV